MGTSAGRTSNEAAVPAGKALIEGVPFVKQLDNYCGPAALSSLFAFWKAPLSQKDIGACVYNDQTFGSNAGDMLLYCRERGFNAYSFNGTPDDLKRYVSAGYPVLTLTRMSRSDENGHYRLVVGYDDEAKTFTLRDSTQPDLVKMPYDEFAYLWGCRGRWAMLAMPRNKDTFRDALGKNNAVLHMDLAQAYLHRGVYDKAEAECTKALLIEPANPYAKKLLNGARTHTPVQL